MFTEENILSILIKELIGKPVKVCVYDKIITQEGLVIAKKTPSVTNTQFESGNPKYRGLKRTSIFIGRHRKFETYLIKRIWFEPNDFDEGKTLRAELDNGMIIDVQN
jgi:hypothetical protein